MYPVPLFQKFTEAQVLLSTESMAVLRSGEMAVSDSGAGEVYADYFDAWLARRLEEEIADSATRDSDPQVVMALAVGPIRCNPVDEHIQQKPERLGLLARSENLTDLGQVVT